MTTNQLPLPTASSSSGRTSRSSNLFRSLDTRRLVTAMLFVLVFALAVRIPTDTDTWWHLRSGETMLRTGQILTTDPFSFTRFGQAWIDHSWGAQIIMELFYKGFGGAGGVGDSGNVGLAVYTALLATGGMFFVWLMCSGDAYQRAFVVVLAAATAAVFWSPRPQMISFLLSTVTLYILYLVRKRGKDHLWVIPVLMVFWVNLHGGFAIGFILLFGTIAGEVFGHVFDSANPNLLSWRMIGKLVLITVISALVLVINPNTVQMWGYPFRTVGIGALQQFIQEWNSPDFHGRETWPFIALMLGTFAAVGLGSKRLNWTELTLVSGTFFLSLFAGRNIATFAIVCAPVLSDHLNAYLEEKGIRLARPRSPRGFMLALNYTILILTIIGAGLKVAVTLSPKLVIEAQTDILPVEAAAYLNQEHLSGKMFNSYNWGGYLMFAAPDYPVFVDGRTDLYDDALLRTWLQTTEAHNWQDTFKQYDIGLAVIEKESALAGALRSDPNWKEVHTDKKAAIFVKQG